jgi:hypothetical protein
MTPAEAQQAALDQLEHLGGKPVVLQANEQLSNQAKISLASSTQPAHVLTYHPAFVHELPYLVCFQCVMAERTLKSAADERFNVASTPDTYRRVQKLVQDKGVIPQDMVTTYSQMVTDGLGTQLRSMPIGIRVDRVIHASHPELHEMQRTIAEKQLTEAAGCLHPNVKAMAPDLLFKASVGMNAALALAWSRLWGDDKHVVPYRLSGHVGMGEKLLDQLDEIPDAPTNDRELVTSLATLLGVEDLYRIGPVGL